jgi:ribosomal protein S19
MTHLIFKKPFKFHKANTLLKNNWTWSHASTIVPTLIGHVIINLFIYITNHMVDNTLGSNQFLI